MIEINEKNHVKLLVRIKQEDGYPPEEWEGLWAVPLGQSLFRIDNIPFYVKGLSCDDIVQGVVEDGKYFLLKVVEESSNSTIRVVISNLEDEREIRDSLCDLGCSIEGTGIPGLIALNIPIQSKNDTIEFLQKSFDIGKIDYEEGAVR
jgi:hypothetical protein